jgi:hypothetical protein
MLKNSPRIPQPIGLRLFVPAITAQMIAARMLPMTPQFLPGGNA